MVMMMICSAMCQDDFNGYFGQGSITKIRMGYSKVGDCNWAVITFKDVDMASQAVLWTAIGSEAFTS
eukprot:593811-Karenia_brevis.AAC.1